MIYLYLKTHNKTGLKYLGKTSKKDPYSYKGSGKYWLRHIEKHGYDVTTQILLVTDDKKELKETGLFFSKLWDIVNSNEWANLREENGDGISSEEAKRINKEKTKNGTHHWQGNGEFQRNLQNKRVENGTHHFLGGKIQKRVNKEKVENGTHNFLFLDRSFVSKENKRRIENGTHHFIGPDFNKRMIKEGKHVSQKANFAESKSNMNKMLVKEGRHTWQKRITCVDENGSTYVITTEEYKANKTLHKCTGSNEGRKRLGLEPRSKSWNSGIVLEKKIECPHCGTMGANMGNMKRHHFENCKSNHQFL